MALKPLKELAGEIGKVDQKQPLPFKDMVENAAGGFVFPVGSMEKLRRFLILGTEGGSFYVDEKTLSRKAAGGVQEALDEHGVKAVAEIVAISAAGRAPKNDQAIFALAMACAHPNDAVRKAALETISDVCRTGTHILMFAGFVDEMRGWGMGLRKAIARWYGSFPEIELGTDAIIAEGAARVHQAAFQAVKYRQRDGWTHRDLLKLAHPKPRTHAQDALFRWITKPKGAGSHWKGSTDEDPALVFPIIGGFEDAQRAESPFETAELVRDHALPWETLKSEHLNEPLVWEALLHAGGPDGMPLGAMTRNLAKMTSIGLLQDGSEATAFVGDALANPEAIKKSRLHPVAILNALLTYQAGKGLKGSLTWKPIAEIESALNAAFYSAFANVRPTGKRTLVAIDTSGSMWGTEWSYAQHGYGSMSYPNCTGSPLMSPRLAAAAMAMALQASGDPVEFVSFAYKQPGVPVDMVLNRQSKKKYVDGLARIKFDGLTLPEAIERMKEAPGGGTDLAMPIEYADKVARDGKPPFETIVVITDNDTYAGGIHPAEALRLYRGRCAVDARMVTMAMVANHYSISDPADAGMLDVVGMDSAVPQIISDFSAGRV